MAFTRKMLKAMGIEEEKIDEIIEAHREVTDALKEDRDKYKADAEKLTDIEKKYNDLKNEVDGKEEDPYKEKYEKEHKDFEEYKKAVEGERTKANKTQAYKELLKQAGVSDKRIDSILKVTVTRNNSIFKNESSITASIPAFLHLGRRRILAAHHYPINYRLQHGGR